MKILLCTLGAAVLLSGCATLKLTEGGEKVRLLDPAEVSSCRQLGRTNASVTARVVFERPESAVAEELETVARNSGANMGGDTIVPLTVIEDGKQTFIVYKCVNPDG
jgi:hypothetical protein